MKSKAGRFRLRMHICASYDYKEICFVLLHLLPLVCTIFGSNIEQDNEEARCLEDITLGLENYCNEGTSKSGFNSNITPFNDAFIEYKSGDIILLHLKFGKAPVPQLRVWNFNKLYKYFHTVVEWNLVDLEGFYTIYPNLLTVDSVFISGKLRLIWHNLRAQGRIAMQFANDSNHFLSTNYDLNFVSGKFQLILLDPVERRGRSELLKAASKRINSELQDDLFWNLQEHLHHYVDKDLKPNIAEAAVIPVNRRLFTEKRIKNANVFIDQMLALGKSFLKATGKWKLDIPNFRKTFGSGIFKADVTATDGTVQDIAALRRATKFSYAKLRYNEFYGYLTFTDLLVQYKRLRVKFLFSVGLGSVTANVGSNKVFLKLILADDSSNLFGYRLVRYDLKVHIKHVKVKVYNNLSVIDWVLSEIVTYVSNLYTKQISLLIEKNLKIAIQDALNKK